jgi:predicted MPP superfamily phosphohydrolase
LTLIAGGVIILLLLVMYMFSEAHRNEINYMNLSFDEFPKSFDKLSIYFISDIHRREISTSMLAPIKGKVDIVIIGGDLTEKGVPFSRVLENIQKLKELGPLYFVWGNNDYEVDFHELDSLLLSNGVKILDNTAVSFESVSGEKLSLLGVDDFGKERARLDLALSDTEKDSFKVLVSHNPEIISQLKEEHRITLVLSGHTHGGQIRLGKCGLYQRGGVRDTNVSKVFISNGYGTTLLPLRFGAPAETHLITISSTSR